MAPGVVCSRLLLNTNIINIRNVFLLRLLLHWPVCLASTNMKIVNEVTFDTLDLEFTTSSFQEALANLFSSSPPALSTA